MTILNAFGLTLRTRIEILLYICESNRELSSVENVVSEFYNDDGVDGNCVNSALNSFQTSINIDSNMNLNASKRTRSLR